MDVPREMLDELDEKIADDIDINNNNNAFSSMNQLSNTLFLSKKSTPVTDMELCYAPSSIIENSFEKCLPTSTASFTTSDSINYNINELRKNF